MRDYLFSPTPACSTPTATVGTDVANQLPQDVLPRGSVRATWVRAVGFPTLLYTATLDRMGRTLVDLSASSIGVGSCIYWLVDVCYCSLAHLASS